MAREVTTFGRIEAGKLYITHRPEFDQAVGALPDGMVSVQVKRVGKKRSSQANAYYWSVIMPIATAAINEAWGETLEPEEVHELMKRTHNSRVIDTESGSRVRIARSTSRLDEHEFYEYVERVRRWLAEFFHADTPDPRKIETTKTELRT